MLIVPGDAAGSTYTRRPPGTPAAAFGPVTPAKNTANVTGTVTTAASAVEELTAVPIVSSALPATASARCAISLSRRVPAKLTRTSVANEPNAANSAICRLPISLSEIANRHGITTAARAARIAAGADQVGSHGVDPGPDDQRRFSCATENALAPLVMSGESNPGSPGNGGLSRKSGATHCLVDSVPPGVRRDLIASLCSRAR